MQGVLHTAIDYSALDKRTKSPLLRLKVHPENYDALFLNNLHIVFWARFEGIGHHVGMDFVHCITNTSAVSSHRRRHRRCCSSMKPWWIQAYYRGANRSEVEKMLLDFSRLSLVLVQASVSGLGDVAGK